MNGRSLLGEPAPDFSDPLGMLAACHERILALCELLDRLPAWLAKHGADDEAIGGAQRVIQYFEQAAPLHHADEEQDLFPLLSGDRAIAILIADLRDQHQELERLWRTLGTQLHALVEGRPETAALQQVAAAFCRAYRSHVDTENERLLPYAAEHLDGAQLAAIGASMAARRGQTTPGSA